MATFTIAAGADDGARFQATSFDGTNTFATIGDASGNSYAAFFRFDNVTIPAGSTIDTAKLTVAAANDFTTNTVNLRITMEDSDDAVAPTTYSAFDALTLTTAYADWSPSNWTLNNLYDTADFTSVFQEVVDRAGWASGNAVMVIIKNNASSTNAYRQVHTYETTGTNDAKLVITWTEPSGAVNSGFFAFM